MCYRNIERNWKVFSERSGSIFSRIPDTGPGILYHYHLNSRQANWAEYLSRFHFMLSSGHGQYTGRRPKGEKTSCGSRMNVAKKEAKKEARKHIVTCRMLGP